MHQLSEHRTRGSEEHVACLLVGIILLAALLSLRRFGHGAPVAQLDLASADGAEIKG